MEGSSEGCTGYLGMEDENGTQKLTCKDTFILNMCWDTVLKTGEI